MQLRVRALETILTEKGYIEPAALDAIVEACETGIGPHNGARVVARAWTDPFQAGAPRRRVASGRYLGHVSRVGEHWWPSRIPRRPTTSSFARSAPAIRGTCSGSRQSGTNRRVRSRTVKDARGVLADFGVTLPPDTRIRVWDSTAETRFLVLPMRPDGTEGWSEERLAALVTRDSMIGTGLPLPSDKAT